jgi:ubiquinone/menaquinone biosynthesis C-methylase UbiE
VRDGGGPALELGCGNGRLLAGYVVDDGLDVEGVDSAADMLAICRRHCAAAGVDVTLHHADWVTLALDREYATLYNPAGSFSLIAGDGEAERALAAWYRHVAPGGQLVLGMSGPQPQQGAPWRWYLRRSATRASDGITFMVHQATRHDAAEQVTHSVDRHEVWGPDGVLRTTYLRRHLLRWWTPEQFVALVEGAGFVDVTTEGPELGYLLRARRP